MPADTEISFIHFYAIKSRNEIQAKPRIQEDPVSLKAHKTKADSKFESAFHAG